MSNVFEQTDSCIEFFDGEGGAIPAIKLSPGGHFYAYGKEIAQDRALYEAFVAYLKKGGYYKEPVEDLPGQAPKTLVVTDGSDLKAFVPDVILAGNPDTWVLLCKASSQAQGWMKSTKALPIEGLGCLVQVTTQQGDRVAEAVAFVPGARLTQGEDGGYILTAAQDGDHA